jgi:hypothetical protein
MLASIHPLGERVRANRFGVTAAAYFVGSIGGGASAGAALGALGSLGAGVPLGQRAGLLAALCLVAASADAWSWPLPTVRRQVNQDWLTRYRGWVYGVAYGFQLGAGATTIVTTAAIHLWLAAALLSGSWTAGLAIGATFGLARSLPLATVRAIDDPAELRRAHHRFQRWAPSARRATSAGLALAALASAGGGLRWPG